MPKRFPHLGAHDDLWLFYELALPEDAIVESPPWYAQLAFHASAEVRDDEYARGHEDIVARWLGPT